MIAWLLDHSGPWFITYFTFLLCGIPAILTKSRLLVALFVYLSVWELFHFSLDLFKINFIFPAVVAGMLIDVGFLWLLEKKLKIDCFVTPLAILCGITYSGIHAIFSWQEVYIYRNGLPWVMTIASLIAVIEGLFDGFNSGRRDFGSFDWPDFNIPWLSNNHKTGKET